MAIAYTVGNMVVTAYLRSDMFEKRRAFMNAWSDACK
jgi:hypothetical protein